MYFGTTCHAKISYFCGEICTNVILTSNVGLFSITSYNEVLIFTPHRGLLRKTDEVKLFFVCLGYTHIHIKTNLRLHLFHFTCQPYNIVIYKKPLKSDLLAHTVGELHYFPKTINYEVSVSKCLFEAKNKHHRRKHLLILQ